MTAPGFTFDRWAFLTAPLPVVLDASGARITETDPDPEFMGGILNGPELEVCVPQHQNPLERDAVVRGLLARWYGVDVTDWPVAMVFVGSRA